MCMGSCNYTLFNMLSLSFVEFWYFGRHTHFVGDETLQFKVFESSLLFFENSKEIHVLKHKSIHYRDLISYTKVFQDLITSKKWPKIIRKINEINVLGSRSSFSSSAKKKFSLVATVHAAFYVVFSLLGYYSFLKWKGMRKVSSNNTETWFVACPRQFDRRELGSTTREFHPRRIVGYGSFCTVYKAFSIFFRTIAAVKRSRHSNEGKTEFLPELSIDLRHKNSVQLLGRCVEKDELVLVYDFRPNSRFTKNLR